MERSAESWRRIARVSQAATYICGLVYGAVPFVELYVSKHVEVGPILFGQGTAVVLGGLSIGVNSYATHHIVEQQDEHGNGPTTLSI